MSERMVLIQAVANLDVYFSDSALAERHVTNPDSQMFIQRMNKQNQLRNAERPLAKLLLVAEGDIIFMPVGVGHVALLTQLLHNFEEIIDVDPRLRHKITGRKELMTMLGQIETVLHGSQVIGPEVLLLA